MIRALLGLIAALAIVVGASAREQERDIFLWGDGIHDDTFALKALSDGAKVLWPNLQPVDRTVLGLPKVSLHNRVFLVTGPVGFTEDQLLMFMLDSYYLTGRIRLVGKR